MKSRRGQSMVEYLLVLAAIVAAIVAFSAGPLRDALQAFFDQSGAKITEAADRIAAR